MVVYSSFKSYLEDCKTIEARIIALESIIDALILSAATVDNGTDNISEYQLNDGQTIIKEVYRGRKTIAAAIDAYETILQRYINRSTGRQFRLIDSKNFKYGG